MKIKNTIKGLLFILISAFIFIPSTMVKAAYANINVSAPGSATVGATFNATVTVSSDENIMSYEYNLSYNESVLTLISGVKYNADNLGSTTSTSRTFTFKVIAPGSSSITVVDALVTGQATDFTDPGISGASITGNAAVVAPTPPSGGSSSGGGSSSTPSKPTTYSTNNYLSSLAITGYTITPEFNKEKDVYNVSVDANVEKINITATPEDAKSRIDGVGEKEVTEGNNKFEIVVTSEKGTTKTYTLNVLVKDENPIEVKINNETYTIIKRLTVLKKPETCEDTKTTINDIEIPTYFCPNTNYTLIGLKDTSGVSNLYIYDEKNNSYSLYNEISFSTLKIGIIDENKSFTGYTKMKTYVNGVQVIGYKTDKLSSYTLLYGINLETGKKNWYLYEQSENTIQKFDLNEFNKTNKQINNAKMLIYGFGGISIVLAFLLIVVSVNVTKKKPKKEPKLILKDNDKEKVEPIKTEKIDDKKEKAIKEEKVKKKKSKHDMFDGL